MMMMITKVYIVDNDFIYLLIEKRTPFTSHILLGFTLIELIIVEQTMPYETLVDEAGVGVLLFGDWWIVPQLLLVYYWKAN